MEDVYKRQLFIQRNVRNLLALIEPTRRLAIGISSACHELPEAPALQYHHAAAVLTIFFLGGLLHIGRIKIGQVDGIFFRKRAGVRILFIVSAARIERCLLYTSRCV